jgi:hypothetical protein
MWPIEKSLKKGWTKIEALLATAHEDIPITFRLCVVPEEIQFVTFQMNVSGIFQADILSI